MSCNCCTTKFNFFHREMGCPNCGLSFCNKCLKQKCHVPNKGSTLNVCKGCYVKLTGNTDQGDRSTTITGIMPPESFLKRLEALEKNNAIPTDPSHPITVYRDDAQKMPSRYANLRAGLDPADQQLLDRLEKLKHEQRDGTMRTAPTEAELRRRLDELKGGAGVSGGNLYVQAPILRAVDNPETPDKLLEQFRREHEIELEHNPQKHTEKIEARLAELRDEGVRPNEGPYIANLHDDGDDDEEEEDDAEVSDRQVDRLAKKIMAEVALDEKTQWFRTEGAPVPASTSTSEGGNKTKNKREPDVEDESMDFEGVDNRSDDAEEELPWCVLCNEDARLRCLDCGGDLYCTKCCAEVHRSWDDRDHRIVAYRKRKG